MTEYHWAKLRDRAIELFGGETPRPELEQEIVDTFEEHPQLVANAIEQIGAQYTTGKVRSGWAVLRTHINTTGSPQRQAVIDDASERTRAIKRAEQWIKTAGIHFDRETEIQDELFGDRGILRDWPDLQERILETWRQARPIGQQLDADLEERSERWKATTGILWNERGTRRLLEQQRANDDDTWITDPQPEPDLPAELQPQETT